jgi:hypothetical protein
MVGVQVLEGRFKLSVRWNPVSVVVDVGTVIVETFVVVVEVSSRGERPGTGAGV